MRRVRDQPGLFAGKLCRFTAEVVPELQRLGVYRRAYTGATLQEHLG